jgi:hypothetical protein
MTADTDSFVRFAALPRRLKHLRPDLSRPHEQPVVWGHLLESDRYWKDSTNVPEVQRLNTTGDPYQWYSGDEQYTGAKYPYPAGMAYLIRLVDHMLKL